MPVDGPANRLRGGDSRRFCGDLCPRGRHSASRAAAA